MARIRFVKQFILFVNTTSLDDVGNLVREQTQFHIKNGKIYDIESWDDKGSVADIKFCPQSAMNGGVSVGVNKECFEILQSSVGTKGKLSNCGCNH